MNNSNQTDIVVNGCSASAINALIGQIQKAIDQSQLIRRSTKILKQGKERIGLPVYYVNYRILKILKELVFITRTPFEFGCYSYTPKQYVVNSYNIHNVLPFSIDDEDMFLREFRKDIGEHEELEMILHHKESNVIGYYYIYKDFNFDRYYFSAPRLMMKLSEDGISSDGSSLYSLLGGVYDFCRMYDIKSPLKDMMSEIAEISNLYSSVEKEKILGKSIRVIKEFRLNKHEPIRLSFH